jgi:arylsulfatase A-like enzyme
MGRLSTSLCCAVAVFLACSEPPAGVESASIVLVTVDTLRADRLGCYGYYRKTTPGLDRFASESVVFENAVTPMATTLPAHVSLMTGTLPGRHGVFHNLTSRAPTLQEAGELRTLAQMLARKGYLTAAFVSATPVKDHTGLDAGFQHFDQPQDRERRAADTTDEAIEWLADDARGAFFLWVHYFDPHDPYDPPPRFRGRFDTGPPLIDFLEARGVRDYDAKILGLNNRYDGEVLYLDTQIRRLFDAIRAAGLWDASAIVFTADHGEALGQHEWIGHGRIYNEQIFVPLIVKLPAGEGTAGTRVARFASLIDVVPTLVGRLGLPIDARDAAQLEGIDLFDPETARESVFSERVHRDRGWEPGRKYTLTGPDWKYHLLTEGEDELYDMRSDRFESRNVLGDHPEIAALLRERISAIVAEGERHTPGEAAPEVPPERLEELRQLGYID